MGDLTPKDVPARPRTRRASRVYAIVGTILLIGLVAVLLLLMWMSNNLL